MKIISSENCFMCSVNGLDLNLTKSTSPADRLKANFIYPSHRSLLSIIVLKVYIFMKKSFLQNMMLNNIMPMQSLVKYNLFKYNLCFIFNQRDILQRVCLIRSSVLRAGHTKIKHKGTNFRQKQ